MNKRALSIGGVALERPIIQAPIGSLASAELVAAVSDAGGLGSLALSWCDAGRTGRLVRAVRARTRAPFAANFVLAFTPTSLPAALEAGVPIDRGEGEVVVRDESGRAVHRYDDAPPRAGMHGDVRAGCLYAGTSVERISAIRPAGELVRELCGQ
jgi:Nitronate monooxygenase